VEPWRVFAISFVLASLSGLAYSLKQYQCFWRSLTAWLGSGCLGLAVTMLLWGRLADTEAGIYALLAMSMLLPAMGITAMDLKPLIQRLIAKELEKDEKQQRKRRKPDSDVQPSS